MAHLAHLIVSFLLCVLAVCFHPSYEVIHTEDINPYPANVENMVS